MLKILDDHELAEEPMHRPSRPVTRVLAWAAIVTSLAIATSWVFGGINRPQIPTTMPVIGSAMLAVYGTGEVEPASWARLAAATTGRLMELKAREGDRVTTGQILAVQDDRIDRATLAELEARQRFFEVDYERKERLAQRDIVSQQVLAQTRASAEEYAAKVRAQKERIALLSIVSPLDGIVLRRDGELGELIAMGTAVLWVGDPAEINIVAAIDEEDIGLVKEGQKVLVKSDAQPGRAIEGRVQRVTPKGDPIAKTFRVRVSLPADKGLMIGMTAEINIVARDVSDALLVPATSVADGHVYRMIEGKPVRTAVETGIRSGVQVQILKGLAVNDPIAVNAADVAKAGR